jgi:PKHD-type hydroxylase
MSAFSPTFPRPLGGPVIAWQGAFSTAEVDGIIALGDGMARERAQLVQAQDPLGKKRITDVAWLVRGPDTAWLFARLEQVVQRLNSQYYKYELYPELRERLQYTIYDSSQGGHYDWHVDHGAAMPDARKLSISLQLSEPTDYQGCDLELQFGDGVLAGPRSRGTVIAFSSYVLHRVSPITSGSRKSLVAWVSGPEFK